MNEEPPTHPDPAGDDPVEARIVAWVLGEASAFEAAELERLCEEKPELLVFRRRMRELHGLLTEAEAAQPDDTWKLPAEKRKVLDEIFGHQEKSTAAAEESARDRRVNRTGRRAFLAIAACVTVTFFVVRMVPTGHEAQATIEIKPRGIESSWGGAGKMTPQWFGTQFESIKSYNNLGKVVDRLSLTERWDVDRDAAIKRLKENIKTENIRGTDLVSIRVREKTDEDAREITRAVAESYRDYRIEIENREADKALAELNKAVRDQEDKVEERRKVLATIVRTKGIIYKGQDSFYGQSGVDKDQGARDALQTNNQIQQEKEQLESQGVAELRADLQAKLDDVENLKDDTREEAIKRGLDNQDYVDAKRDFETDQELLQQMRLKQIDRTIRDNMTDDSIVIHEMPQPVERRVEFKPSSAGGGPAEQLAQNSPGKAKKAHSAPQAQEEVRYKVDGEAGTRSRSAGMAEAAKQHQLARKQPASPAAPAASALADSKPELAEASEMQPMTPAEGTLDSGSAGGLGGSMPAQALRQLRPSVKPSPESIPDDSLTAGDTPVPSESPAGIYFERLEPAAPAEPGFDMVDKFVGKDAGSSPGTVRAGARLSRVPDQSDADLSKLMMESGQPQAATDTATAEDKQYALAGVEQELPSYSFADDSIGEGKKSNSTWRSEGMALKEDKSATPSTNQPGKAPDSKSEGTVDSIRRNLYTAEGNFNLGKYDDAKKEYEDALEKDPYNAAARRGLERVASATSDYYRSAYDHTRAELLSQVDSVWELSVPAAEDSASAGDVDMAKRMAGKNSSALGQTDDSLYLYRGSDLGLIEEDRETLEKRAINLEKQIAGSPDDASRTAKFREWQAINGELIRRAKLEKEKKPVEVVEEISAAEDPYSTFSLNISDASFQLAKAALAKGERPDPASIKPEQFYNAVDYGDPAPAAREPVAATIEQSIHPVIPGRSLVRVAVRTGASGRSASQPLRLTLLVDQSGSMVREDRRAAMERALSQLSGLLTKADVVNVIGFSRTPHLLADGMTGDQSAKLGALVNQTASEGGTNLEEALKLGSELATRHLLAGAQNRIVLFTDGAANLGNAEPARLAEQVKTLRQKGIAFDIAGIAANDLNDQLLSELARNGNGRYYVVGDEKDDTFARQLAGAFRPAAENVKIQVIFNPRRIAKYKLVGFEKDRLKTEDFRNDAVDAAELAAEETGTAIYQVEEIPGGAGEIGELSVRFRDTASGEMVERSWTMPHESTATAFDRATPSMQLAGLSLLAAEKLRGGPLADAVDFKQLTGTIGSVKQFYGSSSRAADMLRLIESIK